VPQRLGGRLYALQGSYNIQRKFLIQFLCAPNMFQENIDGKVYHLHLSYGFLALWMISSISNAQLGECERFG